MSEVIGHRGVASLAPENTLAGIRKAAELGLEWIELDVTLLGDGSAVMFHDPRLNRTTNGRGHLKKQTFDSVKSLDAGGWHSGQWQGERVPQLDETLRLIKDLGLGLNLELKPNRCDLHLLVDRVVTALERENFPSDKLLVSSFNHKALVLFRRRSEYRIGCLFETLPRSWRHKAKQVGAVSIHVNAKKLKEAGAKNVKSAGYELYCYTVNDTQLFSRLKGWGVDGIFSDCPQDLK
ncbi:hypothetical protein GZ77_20200 [Endozoicomonas montiporae]|uniref:GP-PDE domain-containing protein n=2 Tax=Endozoicomonas montiporae TaxID=1027273 RepID=A0A081N2W4_9GAMM|nr:hypothetical protein GZ77_20200 [Endozoicomonas montiporae]